MRYRNILLNRISVKLQVIPGILQKFWYLINRNFCKIPGITWIFKEISVKFQVLPGFLEKVRLIKYQDISLTGISVKLTITWNFIEITVN